MSERHAPNERLIALAGNPNVGKSTLFNQLTGLHQHTGNWPGKTVCVAQGLCEQAGRRFQMIDLPGTYSLNAQSAEEEVARDFLCFGGADAVCVVCDATCLKRNLNLALQTLEITGNAVLCVNLMDEARKKGVRLDLDELSRTLGVPVVGASARQNRGVKELVDRLYEVTELGNRTPFQVAYPTAIERAAARIQSALATLDAPGPSPRWLSLRIVESDGALLNKPNYANLNTPEVRRALDEARALLRAEGLDAESVQNEMVAAIYAAAETICERVVLAEDQKHFRRQLKVDRLLTGKALGIPVMLLLLALVFYLTITGANYPSQWLSAVLFGFQDTLAGWMAGAPAWLSGFLLDGVYRVTAWVVSVMLPPMAIFFPLFTLLEDLGYLPRVAFNLDSMFRKCKACGKQALCMCMGFGCNAAGVIGCRIIDSPRERLIAILTNSLVPCNGRFPTLITLITIFFIGSAGGALASVGSALGLTLIILLGVLLTFALSRFLSATLLKGVPSAFTLELPPYRRPQVGKVIVRSIFDRTLFVLGRALVVAAPAGGLIYILANVCPGGVSLLARMCGALDPLGRLMGMDGTILTAFILGFPANEIVLPIAIMGYLSGGTLVEMSSLSALWSLLTANGWTAVTAVCVMLFSLLHWPCSTTCLTIYRETRSAKWTAIAMLAPTVMGMALCILVNLAARLIGTF